MAERSVGGYASGETDRGPPFIDYHKGFALIDWGWALIVYQIDGGSFFWTL